MAAEDDLLMSLDRISRQLEHIITMLSNIEHRHGVSRAPPSGYNNTEGAGSPSTVGSTNEFDDRDHQTVVVDAASRSRSDDGAPLLEFALGRRWNRDDTRRIFTSIYELQQHEEERGDVTVDQILTDHQCEAIMRRVVREYLENQTVASLVGPEWFDNNFDDLFVQIMSEFGQQWMSEEDGDEGSELRHQVLLDDTRPDGGGGSGGRGGGPTLSEGTIREQLQTRVCREDEEKMCTICQDELYRKLGTLKCGHEYHVDCIESWLRQSNVCPLCRAKAILLDVDN